MKRYAITKYFLNVTGIAIMAFPLLWCPVLAGSPGTSRAEFLLIGVGGRPTGMGEAFAAVADDVNTISYNPAGLGTIRDIQVTLMHNEWIDGIDYEYAGIAYGIGERDTAGLELRYLHTADIMGRGLNGAKTGDFSVCNLAATFSYGRKISDSLSFGTSIKIIHERLEDEKATGVGLDFGGLYGININNDRLQFGAVVQNLGRAPEFVEESEPLPLNFKIATAYKTLDRALILSVDTNISEYAGTYLNIGSEYRLMDIAFLRAGYKFDNDLEAGARLNFGIGLGWKDYQFDYTFVPFNDLGQTHRFSLMAKLGRKKKAHSANINKYFSKKIESAKERKETIEKIVKEFQSIKQNKKEAIIKLSDKNVYINDSVIDIENLGYEIFERLSEVLSIMDEYEIIVLKGYEYIAYYFMFEGIETKRISLDSDDNSYPSEARIRKDNQRIGY